VKDQPTGWKSQRDERLRFADNAAPNTQELQTSASAERRRYFIGRPRPTMTASTGINGSRIQVDGDANDSRREAKRTRRRPPSHLPDIRSSGHCCDAGDVRRFSTQALTMASSSADPT
jgi:hypothetical protein